MIASKGQPLIELKNICKKYQTLLANDNINIALTAGEIHAVLGENGAGKSTMMKIIYGVIPPTSGQIFWQGKSIKIQNPAHARSLGIGMVFQHFSLFETLSVLQNVALSLTDKVNMKTLAAQITQVSEKYGLPISPSRLVHSLSVGERQRVEIIRCLLQKPKLLIMDEPTSVLTPQAVQKLFATLRQLSQEGCSILYISHKLDEIQELCHFATVLRAGKITGHCMPAKETSESMARLMIGKDLPVCQHGKSKTGEVMLNLSNLSQAPDDPLGIRLSSINLQVRAGEIVGIAGISGNGQQELLMAISGEQLATNGAAIELCGQKVGKMGTRKRRKLGLGFVPEERLGRATVPSMNITQNALLTLTAADSIKHGMVQFSYIEQFTKKCINDYTVKCSGTKATAQSLSGGNLQKFIMGREILQSPKVMVVSQPTWGVDLGAAAFIRQSLIDLRNQGAAILLVSEELDELFEVCDKIAVIAKGKLSPCKPITDTSVEEVGVLMAGIWQSVAAEKNSIATYEHLQ